MAAQAAAAEAAAHRRQEAEWARQKEAQRKRDSGQTAREAELQRQKEQYQRELERRMAMERNEAAEMKQKAARDAANARAAAKRKEDEKLREQMAQREREAARKRRAAASQPNANGGTPSRASGSGAAGRASYTNARSSAVPLLKATQMESVGGGHRIDPELARKRDERVRELRRAEAERDAQDMAGVQKRVDQEVDRWARERPACDVTHAWSYHRWCPGHSDRRIRCEERHAESPRIVHPDKVDQNASAAYKAAQQVFTTLQLRETMRHGASATVASDLEMWLLRR